MRPDIEDKICLSVPKPSDPTETENRWWTIRQPVPSVAFSLQGRLFAALGPGIVETINRLLATSETLVDPLVDSGGNGTRLQDAESTRLTLGDAEALKVLRRARTGRCLVDEGENVALAGSRLRTILGFLTPRTGANFQAPLLLGEARRVKDNMEHTWEKPALVHQLLLASELTYGGNGDGHWQPSGLEGDESPGCALWHALNHGSVNGFIRSLDEILSGPEELMLLSIWAGIHLFRPF